MKVNDRMFGEPDATVPNTVVPRASLQPDKKLAAKTKETQLSGEPHLDISHALRTRLTIITLIGDNLDLLYDHLDDEKRRELIRDLCLHTRRLNDLACDLLAQLS